MVCGVDGGKNWEMSPAFDGSPRFSPLAKLLMKETSQACLTELIEHVRDVFSIDDAVAVAVKDLERLPHRTDL